MEQNQKISTRRKERMTYANAFSLNGKTPPQAVELEQAVLGALMLDQNALSTSIETLKPDYFYKPEHQAIFKAIHSLFEKGQQVDLLTVVQALTKRGQLEEVGGAYYVTSLSNHVTSAAHIEYHARILSEKFIQRELIRISTETISDAYDETTDVIDLLDKTEQKMLEISDQNFRSDYHAMDDVMAEAMAQIEAAQNNDSNTVGLPTGFIGLDRTTAGFHPGTLIILAARPAMGKTAFALSIARNMAVDHKIPIAFFSLEMTRVELAMRLISSETGIAGDTLKKGEKLPDWQKEMMMQKCQTLNDAPIYIDDTPQLNIFELRAKCRRLQKSHQIKMVFIDYLQLMQGGTENNKNGNREQEISYISRQLKALSKELQVPVLALSQLSRAVETRGGSKKPQLSDLRESGAIEQDADIVMFIYRPEYYDIFEDEHGDTHGAADIILAKHRAGATDTVRLRFVKDQVRFENPENVGNMGGIEASGMMPNTGFDSAPGTMVLGSKMNDESPNFGQMPNDEAPF
ncbi:MAG: replicative DNA helicase [Bacteroidales bacterium]|nr:replicative DNA helicase [Bacteroidales bacterium]